MTADATARRILRSSPYWPVLSHRRLGRVLPGLTVSALGDGMAVVAVSWLALQLSPPAQRGVWVAVAVAAYTLPSAAGTLAFGRLLRGHSGAQLAGWDAILRGRALAAVPVAYALGALSIGFYVVLLAGSALLHSWGSAGRFTLIAELLPDRDHLAANATLAGYLQRWPLWPITIGIVIAFGVAMLPLGLGAPGGLALVSLAAAGLIWAPCMATTMALFQRSTSAANRSQVLATNSAVIVLAGPLGSILGAPLVTLFGARSTLLICAVGTIGLGLIAVALRLRRRST